MLAALALAALPFLIPVDWYLARALATGLAIATALKLRLLQDGRDFDPEIRGRPLRLLTWLLVPPATHWPRTADQARANRRRAPLHLGRGALLLAAMLAVAAVKPAAAGHGLAIRSAVEMAQFYLLLAAMTDGLQGLCALAAVRTDPVFVRPLLARSPGEFWSRRWNLVVHRFARHYVFAPVARRRGTALGVLATFAASGVMHEYLALAAVGGQRYAPGFMLGFFLLHGLAVLVIGMLARRGWPAPPAALAIPLQLGWLLVTTPLFFHSLRPQIAAFDAACLAMWQALFSGLS